MNEVKAIMDELHSLRDINVSDLDELGKAKCFFFINTVFTAVQSSHM